MIRRSSQTIFLALFFVLFLYVCCPYPASPAKNSIGWTPQSVDPETETIFIVHETSPDWITINRDVFLVDSSTKNEFGRFHVASKQDGGVTLRPKEKIPAESWEELSTSFGPWALYENSPSVWPNHYETARKSKTLLPAPMFLYADPVIGLSTLRFGNFSVGGVILGTVVVLFSILFPRCFCSFVCPLGTLIDCFPKRRRNVPNSVRRLKYFLLTGIFVSGLFGVAIVGFVSPISLTTRGLNAVATPLQTAWYRDWYQVPSPMFSEILAAVLFFGVLLSGLAATRFWCRFLCPTGALLSLAAPLRCYEIEIDKDRCISCGRCTARCEFGAIDDSISLRHGDCTLCTDCVGWCPTNAIFVRNRKHNEKPPAHAVAPRREFLGVLSGLVGGLGIVVGFHRTDKPNPPLRPPGSLPEKEFLELCVRCGECLQACPNNALQAVGVDGGLEKIWTPRLVPDWSGCEPSCNNCGAVCPSGAIRKLSMDEKRRFVIGLAVIDKTRCLPFADGGECRLCVEECSKAGYDAIEFVAHGTELDAEGLPVEGSGVLAPVVVKDRCIGCGLCQTRCRAVNVKEKRLIDRSAIVVEIVDN